MAQGDYVVVDLEKKDDRVTLILHVMLHPFKVNNCVLSNPDASCFQLDSVFFQFLALFSLDWEAFGKNLEQHHKGKCSHRGGEENKRKIVIHNRESCVCSMTSVSCLSTSQRVVEGKS